MESVNVSEESTARIYTRGYGNNQHIVTELRKLTGAKVQSVGALHYHELSIAHGFTITFDTGQVLELRMQDGWGEVKVTEKEK